MAMAEFTEEKEREYKRKSAIGLLIFSAILLASLALPWFQMNFSWSTPTSGLTEAELDYQTNGLGMGEFTGSYNISNKTGGNWLNNTFSSPTFVPSQAVGGAIIGIIAVFNVIMAVSFLNNQVKQIIPETFTKIVDSRWDTIIFIEAVTLIGLVSLFSTFYFSIPFQLSLNIPIGGYPSSVNDLLELYANTYSFFEWATTSAQVSNPPWNRVLSPGIGMYLSFIGGIGLLYNWFLYYTAKNNWPEVWRRRSILIPLMIVVNFMPMARKYAATSASTLPMLLSPFFFHIGGILYFGLTIGLTFLFYRAANLESNINQIVEELYTLEDLSEEEYNEKRSQVDTYSEKATLTRKLLVPLLIGIFFTITLMLYDFATLFQSYVGESIGVKYLAHTPTDWILMFSPMVTIVLIAVFRQ